MATICVVRPFYDWVTSILHGYADYVVDHLRQSSVHTCHNLSGRAATRRNFDNTLTEHECDIFVFYGHGDVDALAEDSSGSHYIVDRYNAYLLAGRIVYAAACWAAEELGTYCVDKGALCFLGYREKLAVVDNPLMRSLVNRPLDLILQHTQPDAHDCSEAFGKARESWRQAVAYYLYGPGSDDDDAPVLAPAMACNMESFYMIVPS